MNKAQKITVIIISALLAVLVAALLIVGGIARGRAKKSSTPSPAPAPTFSVPEFDKGAVDGEPKKEDIDADSQYQVMESGQAGKVGMSLLLTVEGDSADVYFTTFKDNPGYSRLLIYDAKGQKLLGETGLIKPGQYVKSIKFTNPPKKSTLALAKILNYDKKSYYSIGSVTGQIAINVPSVAPAVTPSASPTK